VQEKALPVPLKSYPLAIGSGGSEVPRKQIGRDWVAVLAVGGHHATTAFVDGLQARFSHQSRNTMPATADALCPQFSMHTGTAIDLTTLLEHPADLLRQPLILHLALYFSCRLSQV
jgi:hypothetical protein